MVWGGCSRLSGSGQHLQSCIVAKCGVRRRISPRIWADRDAGVWNQSKGLLVAGLDFIPQAPAFGWEVLDLGLALARWASVAREGTRMDKLLLLSFVNLEDSCLKALRARALGQPRQQCGTQANLRVVGPRLKSTAWHLASAPALHGSPHSFPRAKRS